MYECSVCVCVCVSVCVCDCGYVSFIVALSALVRESRAFRRPFCCQVNAHLVSICPWLTGGYGGGALADNFEACNTAAGESQFLSRSVFCSAVCLSIFLYIFVSISPVLPRTLSRET